MATALVCLCCIITGLFILRLSLGHAPGKFCLIYIVGSRQLLQQSTRVPLSAIVLTWTINRFASQLCDCPGLLMVDPGTHANVMNAVCHLKGNYTHSR